MGDSVMIASFYNFEPFVAGAHRFPPKRIYLFVDKETMKNEPVKGALEKVKMLYSSVAEINVVSVEGNDIYSSASKVVETIDKEKGSDIIINISGAWKLLALSLLYAAYARKLLVKEIICNDISVEDKVVEVPKLDYDLTGETKRALLEQIADRKDRSIEDIADKLKISRGMAYQHLKELKDRGYVDEQFGITLAGRLALL